MSWDPIPPLRGQNILWFGFSKSVELQNFVIENFTACRLFSGNAIVDLKKDWEPLLFESEDPEDVWKLFCGLENKLRKSLLFNEVTHDRNEITQCIPKPINVCS